MLASYAVKKFLARELESYNFMKKLSRRQLLQMVDELDPKPDFISPKKMWKHQLATFLICIYTEYFLPYLDMGLGKSRVILEVIAYLKKCGKLKCALIVVPNSVAVETWVMEVEKHRPDLNCIPMYGSTKERFRLLEDNPDADLFVIPYAGLNWMCSSLQKIKGRKNRKLMIDRKLLQIVSRRFNFSCLDEITSIMNHQSLSYRVCRQISNNYTYRFGMAGIPTGRDPQVLWPQFMYCDHGETLGETLGIFRAAFFKRKENYWSGAYDYKLDKKKQKLLHRTIQNRSIYYNADECMDMPPCMSKSLYVPFTDDMRAYYNQIVDRFSEGSRSDLRLVRNTFLQLRQLASGFIGLIDDETGERAQIEFPENPKLEALVQLLQEKPENRKFLVFHQYIWTGDRISQELSKLGIKHGRIRGGQKDNPKILREFVEKDATSGLIINNDCGAFALNLQVANYLFVFESPVSPIVRGQMEKRIHRGDQRRWCYITDIIMRKNTADETIQKYLKQGQNMERALMRGKKALKLERI